MSCISQSSILFKWGHLSLKSIGLSLLLSTISLTMGITSCKAAETVILKYKQTQMQIPVADLETLSQTGIPSRDLKNFLDQTPIQTESMSQLLAAAIPDTGIPLGKTDIQFLLFQLNKLVGDPAGRENLLPLAKSLRSAYLDKNMSFLELVKRYPKSKVRLNVAELNRVYEDVDLFVQRITPLFNFFKELLPDLVCDCQLKSDVAQANSVTPVANKRPLTHLSSLLSSLPHRPRLTFRDTNTLTLNSETHHNQAQYRSDCLEPTLLSALSKHEGPGHANRSHQFKSTRWQPSRLAKNHAQTPKISNYIPPRISQKVVLNLGPFQRSFSVADLTVFAETGDYPKEWNFYFRTAKIKPEAFRNVLTSEGKSDPLELDSFFNNLLGEYALFQVGQIIYTPSRKANVQALRSTLVLSAIDDQKTSLLELIQNYPAPEINVDARKVLKLTRKLKSTGNVRFVSKNLEDLFVDIQREIAKSVCDCVQSNP